MNDKLSRAMNKGQHTNTYSYSYQTRMMLCGIKDQKVVHNTFWVQLVNDQGDVISENGWVALTEPVENIFLLNGGKLDPNRHKILLLYSGTDPLSGLSFIVQMPGKAVEMKTANVIEQKGPMWILSNGGF